MRAIRMPKLSFAGQFLAFGLVVLVGGMLTIGFWIQREIEDAVTARTAGVTSLYVNSVLAPHVDSLREGPDLTDDAVEAFDDMLLRTGLARDIVAFKLWAPDGTVLYSPNRVLIGQAFSVDSDLRVAFAGGVVSHVSDLSEPENAYEKLFWDSLIETYAPVRLEGVEAPIAVAEFYQLPDALFDEIREARLRTWGIVGLATVIMYALLAGIVGRASRMISTQRRELEENVDHLGRLLNENEGLQHRMRKAAGRTTSLNEQYLRRISADLHDGPAQDVSLALLRLEELSEPADGSASGHGRNHDVETIRHALDSAMADLRSIAAGLRLPELESLTPAEAAMRVVADFERVTGTEVELDLGAAPSHAPLPHKITLFRLLQEALANGFRHAPGSHQHVTVGGAPDHLVVEVSDDGPGFDPEAVSGNGSLGLAGMRERVEVLGGHVAVDSVVGRGTTVAAHIPIKDRGLGHG